MSITPSPSRRALVGTFLGTAAAIAAIGEPLEASSSTVPSEMVSFVVYLPAKPEARDQMRKKLFEVVDAMAREPDFVNTWVHEKLDEPNTLVLYETWACSREYFIRHHLGKPYRLAYEAALPNLLSSERRIEFLKGIRAYPRRKEV